MAAVFPFVVLAGPADSRDRLLASLAAARLPERYHMGRLVVVDERPIVQAWADEDDLLAGRGRERLRADAVWREILAKRLELDAWRQQGEGVTVVVGLDGSPAGFSARFAEAAAVVSADAETSAGRLGEALSQLWRSRHGDDGPAPPVASREDFDIVARDESHFEAHARQMLVPRDEVEAAIRRTLSRSPREGEVRTAVRCARAVGYTGLRRVRPRNGSSFWAPRAGRSLPSHMVAGRRRPTRWLCFWGTWRDRQTFVLHTFYPGRPAPREIHDPQASPRELKEAVAFWATHAIVVDGEER